jgi:hypothetical protein
MTTAINFYSEFGEPAKDHEAFTQLCDYLVYKGKYKNTDAARRDAKERVSFLEKMDFYEDKADLGNASFERKAALALIEGHDLQAVLADNKGFLPSEQAAEPVPQAEAGQTAPAAAEPEPEPEPESEPATSAGKRPITEVFSAIELDLRTGLDRDQIVRKLMDSGLSADNAADAIEAVVRQRRQKQQTRLLAGTTIAIVALVMYYFAR